MLPPDPLVGCGVDTPPRDPPHSAPTILNCACSSVSPRHHFVDDYYILHVEPADLPLCLLLLLLLLLMMMTMTMTMTFIAATCQLHGTLDSTVLPRSE